MLLGIYSSSSKSVIMLQQVAHTFDLWGSQFWKALQKECVELGMIFIIHRRKDILCMAGDIRSSGMTKVFDEERKDLPPVFQRVDSKAGEDC